ncbi:hypothetical protein [Nocardioides alcanivorans]|uniref:hypothetical protein n=1 Tax=Nocardioides alcanivorans TaxID=2897352 RepID=UPI001F1BD5F8|nr:hypothetical protein [Nocardioides alcanivorans]
MNRSASSVALAGLLTVGLVLVSAPSDAAKVKPSDVLNEADFEAIFSDMAGAEFFSETAKKIHVPAKKCARTKKVRVKSARSFGGFVITGESRRWGGSHVAEFKSVAAAKKSFSAYQRFARKCTKFEVHGATYTHKSRTLPRVGQQRVGFTEKTKSGGGVDRGASLMIRQGKRIAVVSVGGAGKVTKKQTKRLAKIAAKKMK